LRCFGNFRQIHFGNLNVNICTTDMECLQTKETPSILLDRGATFIFHLRKRNYKITDPIHYKNVTFSKQKASQKLKQQG
jgi:hypothetical protein